MTKPVIIFTNYADCENILLLGGFVFQKDNKVIFVDLKDFEKNTIVYSLSLFYPEKESKMDGCFEILPILCPTIRNYRNFKLSGDWSQLKKQYYAVLAKRKDKIVKFLKSLKNDHIYFICSPENTSYGCNSIRKWIYITLSNGTAKDWAVYIYRDGVNENQVYKEDIGVNSHNARTERSDSTGYLNNPIFDVTNIRSLDSYDPPLQVVGRSIRSIISSTGEIGEVIGNQSQPNTGGDWFDNEDDDISDEVAVGPMESDDPSVFDIPF